MGGNVGEVLAQCRLALQRLHRTAGVRIMACSHFYRTEPVGYTQQSWFVNAACLLETALPPLALLGLLQRLERQAGRRPTWRNAPRTLDLDILLWGRRTIRQGNLRVPHPRLHLRRFALQPLAELQPTLYHPKFGKTIDTLLREVDDLSVVERVAASIPRWNGDRRGSHGPSCSLNRPSSDHL